MTIKPYSMGIGFVLLAAVMILLTASCGSASMPPRAKSAEPNLWAWAWEAASPSQRRAMEDGEVTFAEYEAAALRAVQCINDIGDLAGEAVFDKSSNTYQVAARGRVGPDSDKKRIQTDDCYKEHWNAINDAWGAQNQPSEKELADARTALAACLREAGLAIPDPASPADFAPHQSTAVFQTCAREVGEKFGLPNFGG